MIGISMNNYQVFEQSIGKGSFGTVYLGMNITNGRLVAVKTEPKGKKNLLAHENNIMKYVCGAMGSSGTLPLGIVRPMAYWEDDEKLYLVMDLLGPNVDALHKICGRSFGLKTILILTEQMLKLVRHYHRNDVIHRDIKPSNFLIDFDLPHRAVHLVDFGLAKKYKIRGEHIPFASGVTRVGSLRYMSKYVHDSIEPSCRDDMYSLGYCIVYLFTGMLPWHTEMNKVPRSERHTFIGNIKKNTSNRELCASCLCVDCKIKAKQCGFQLSMRRYFDYLDTLDFSDSIDYDLLLGEINTCIKEHGISRDLRWDWDKYYVNPSIPLCIPKRNKLSHWASCR